MAKKKLAILLGSICLLAILVAIPLMVACAAPTEPAAPATPTTPTTPATPTTPTTPTTPATPTTPTTPSAPAVEPENVYKWRAVSLGGYSRPEEPISMTLWMQDFLTEITNGQIETEWFFAGELIPPGEGFDAIVTGLVEWGEMEHGYVASEVPESKITLGLPGFVRNAADVYSFYYDDPWNWVDKFRDIIAEQDGCYYLGPRTGGFEQAGFMMTRPIERLSDFEEQGFKLRSYGELARWMDKCGAPTVFIPWEEIYSAVATGVVDGNSWGGPSSFKALGVHEISSYYLWVPFVWNAGTGWFVNGKIWNEISDDLKIKMEYATWLCATRAVMRGVIDNEMTMDWFKSEFGIQEINLPPEDINIMVEKGYEIWDDVAAQSPRCAEGIQLMHDWMKWRGYAVE